MTSFLVLTNKFPLILAYTALALLPDCTEGFSSSTIVICKNFGIFYFPFSQVSSNSFIISFSFFPELMISTPSISMLQIHKPWVPYQLPTFKLPTIIYNRSLVISVNDAKYIHLLSIFLTLSNFSYCN